MNPHELGKKYSRIAKLYESDVDGSSYGVTEVMKAFSLSKKKGKVLDVGCGVGGRIIDKLEKFPVSITGIDVSEGMLDRAREKHPEHYFEFADVCTWETNDTFDFILAWDSIFHLPFALQEPVIEKLCDYLAPDGVLIYTFGNDVGYHVADWHNDTFYYSSIGIEKNIEILQRKDVKILHLEMDQLPDERHVYIIAKKKEAVQ